MNTPHPLTNTVIVFDWGNTVMQELPAQSGAMVDWPVVQAVDGITDALEALKDTPIYLATNAAESTVEQVWQALRRVNLDQYFRAIFTPKELGSRKPRIEFFRQLESVTGHAAHQMVMIGDTYAVDILGAKAAGWRALWYNPQHQTAVGLLPLHDVEFEDMRTLPQMLTTLPLPDLHTTFAWLAERGTPFNIISHVQLTAAAAYQIAVWMAQNGHTLNPVLTHRGAMLHDLCKIDSIHLHENSGEYSDHAAMACDLLNAYGQPDLAEIANRHMASSDLNSARNPVTWEQKIVHYADKLAEGNRLVTPQERFNALMDRYPQFQTEWEAGQPLLLALEGEICAAIHRTPPELYTQLQKAILGK